MWDVSGDECLTYLSKAVVFQMLGSLHPSFFLEKDVDCSTLPRSALVFRSFSVSSKTSSAVAAAPCQQGLKAHLWGGDPRFCVLAHFCITDLSVSPLERVARRFLGRVCPHSQLIQSKTSFGDRCLNFLKWGLGAISRLAFEPWNAGISVLIRD